MIIVLCICLFCSIGYSLFVSSQGLEVSNYLIKNVKITESFRVVHLSDIHNAEFGEGNMRLLDEVRRQEPDVILITGDVLNSEIEDHSVAVELIGELITIAPVYISLGNQDIEYGRIYGVDVINLFSQAGATVLEYNMADITIRNNRVRLGGLYGYCNNAYGENKQEEMDYLENFQNTDAMSILLCHLPTCWYQGIDLWDVDCVLSGHVHGGQMRFPVIGGVYAPDEGWFPGRLCGIYESDDGERALILSRGLGSSGEAIPRFNNVPEIVVVDFMPKSVLGNR